MPAPMFAPPIGDFPAQVNPNLSPPEPSLTAAPDQKVLDYVNSFSANPPRDYSKDIIDAWNARNAATTPNYNPFGPQMLQAQQGLAEVQPRLDYMQQNPIPLMATHDLQQVPFHQQIALPLRDHPVFEQAARLGAGLAAMLGGSSANQAGFVPGLLEHGQYLDQRAYADKTALYQQALERSNVAYNDEMNARNAYLAHQQALDQINYGNSQSIYAQGLAQANTLGQRNALQSEQTGLTGLTDQARATYGADQTFGGQMAGIGEHVRAAGAGQAFNEEGTKLYMQAVQLAHEGRMQEAQAAMLRATALLHQATANQIGVQTDQEQKLFPDKVDELRATVAETKARAGLFGAQAQAEVAKFPLYSAEAQAAVGRLGLIPAEISKAQAEADLVHNQSQMIPSEIAKNAAEANKANADASSGKLMAQGQYYLARGQASLNRAQEQQIEDSLAPDQKKADRLYQTYTGIMKERATAQKPDTMDDATWATTIKRMEAVEAAARQAWDEQETAIATKEQNLRSQMAPPMNSILGNNPKSTQGALPNIVNPKSGYKLKPMPSSVIKIQRITP